MMKIAVKTNDEIPHYLISRISQQAEAWHLPKKMISDWLKERKANELADLTHKQGKELLAALADMKQKYDSEPASQADVASLKSYCKSMGIYMDDIYARKGEVTTRADVRDMRQRVRDRAQSRARARHHDGGNGEQQYYEHNPVRLS